MRHRANAVGGHDGTSVHFGTRGPKGLPGRERIFLMKISRTRDGPYGDKEEYSAPSAVPESIRQKRRCPKSSKLVKQNNGTAVQEEQFVSLTILIGEYLAGNVRDISRKPTFHAGKPLPVIVKGLVSDSESDCRVPNSREVKKRNNAWEIGRHHVVVCKLFARMFWENRPPIRKDAG